jgi:hypothetical protein
MQKELIDQCKSLQVDMDRAIDAALDKGGLFDVTQNCGGSENESQPGQQANKGISEENGRSVPPTGD